jgi:hypothetical protein
MLQMTEAMNDKYEHRLTINFHNELSLKKL